MKISIIVPVYNVKLYLSRCIDSILNQTYQDFELILVDDGSTDCSKEICDKYASKDIRIKVFHKSNGGVSSARNFGLSKITGNYVTFVDSDDFLMPNHLANLAQYADIYDWVMTNRKVIDENNKIQYEYNLLKKIEAYGRLQVDEVCHNLKFYILVTNKLYKTTIIKRHNIQFINNSHIHEDGIFNLSYTRYTNSLIVLPESTYYGVINPNSLTHMHYANLIMYINSAEELDSLLRSNKLGKYMSYHAAQYMFNCYLRAFLGCLYYPLSILSTQKRIQLIQDIIKSSKRTVLFSQYKTMIPKWLAKRIKHYYKKIFSKIKIISK